MSARELTMEVLELPHIKRHRLSVDDYYRMSEVGVLAHDARVELIEGEVIDMASIGTKHYWAVVALNRLIQRAVGDTAIVAAQAPLRLDQYNEPEPDLVLLHPGLATQALPTGSDCFLIIEVSDTTLAYDVKVKAPLYAKHGVPEYWVIDLNKKQLRRFAAPKDGAWTDVSTLAAPGPVALPGLDGVTVDLSSVF
jgi:Uma2 family endonuclease